MLAFLKTKAALALLGTLLVGSLTSTAVVMAAQNHAGPFGHKTSADDTMTKTPDNNDGNTYHAQGLIKSVTFASGNTSGSLTFLPNGTTTTIVVHFTSQTHIEVADSDDHEGADDSHSSSGQPGAAGLKAGLFANIVGAKQSDGSVLAKEIQANTNGNAHHGDDDATPEADDHDDATPDADEHHGTATPQADH